MSAYQILARLEFEVIETGLTFDELLESFATWPGCGARGPEALAVVTDKRNVGYRLPREFIYYAMKEGAPE